MSQFAKCGKQIPGEILTAAAKNALRVVTAMIVAMVNFHSAAAS